ncbi:MAG: hypothetical protein RL199_429 [Pseudomonadota bacterium]|jgi:uncharacterized membrane protein
MTGNRSFRGLVSAIVAATLTMLVLDLAWLGTVARGLYDAELGPLMRPQAHVGAAAAFYVLYVGAVLRHAVLPASRPAVAARRGGELGFLVYAAYELTNWAVIAGWPPALVPVDLAWGVVLTALVSGAARLAYEWAGRTRAQ